ncbi:hypothetical protein [Arthrobacter sp. Edens01]|uniref:hypothetical protein n=1 Tax=Arthrobacter sp. Edens01 TaxID=1732020 RepID=UPI0006DAB94B|nr:hypothetical protein [Arthrobacter sp. Edens01]KPN21713.1 hypothetical protein AO716_01445 [Arthrobacter sp. Edens01]
MKRTTFAAATLLALTLTACGTSEPAPNNRTATGADAEYVKELIAKLPPLADYSDKEILGMADDFCAILNGTTTPSKAMNALYESIGDDAETFAFLTVGAKCSNQLYPLSEYLGYL